MLRLIYGVLSTDLVGQNTKIFLKPMTIRAIFTNPCNYRVKFELYKITIRKDEKFNVPGQYNGNPSTGLPFTTGSNSLAANAPYSGFWQFWNQDVRAPLTSGGHTPVLPGQTDRWMRTNVNDTAVPPLDGSLWELSTPSAPIYVREGTRLTTIFPRITKQAKIRRVCKINMAPLTSYRRSWRCKMPEVIEPNFYISDNCPDIQRDVGHFYFAVAKAERPPSLYKEDAQGGIQLYPAAQHKMPAQVIYDIYREYNCKIPLQQDPNFQIAHADDSIATQGWGVATGFYSIQAGIAVALTDMNVKGVQGRQMATAQGHPGAASGSAAFVR